MIKVALISHSGAFTGAEKMLFELARLLQESKEYYPIVFLPENYYDSSFSTMCDRADMETALIPKNDWYVNVNAGNSAAWAAETIRKTHELAEQLRAQDIGLVVCNTMTSLVPSLAAREAQIPSILWIHGILDSFLIPAKYSVQSRMIYDRLLMYLSDAVVCCSDWTKQYYEPLCLRPICTINNWSEHPRDSVRIQCNNTFVCLNTFDHHKGVITLLKAAVLLKERYTFKLELYGTGTEESALRKFVRNNALKEYVIFKGRTTHVDEVYKNSFCLVQPSYIEPFGLTITEAMSHGRPVIAARSGGPDTIVKDSETGFLVPARDEEALAEKMAYFLEHPDTAEAFGKAGKKRYQELFSPERGKQEFFKVFETVLSRQTAWTQTDTLMKDLLWHQLQTQSSGMVSQPSLSITSSGITYQEAQLCFSGPIKRKRCYRVSCARAEINAVKMIFTSHDSKPLNGKLLVRLMQGGVQIASGTADLANIKKEDWTTIPVKSQNAFSGNTLTVEISFEYQAGSGIVGVYEDRGNRGFWFKVFHKLGIPIQGMDALIIQME